jgi:predicted nucleic acid-binding protein
MTQAAPGTANVRLYTDTTQPPERVFLDANVVLDIYEHNLATSDRTSRRRKHPDLANLLDRLRTAKCAVLVTPHVLEEVFHILSQRLLRPLLAKAGCADEKELRGKEPAKQAAARHDAVTAFRQAAMAAARKGAVIVLPTGNVDGKQVHDKFVALLETCPQIGGKDAIHVVTGALLECTHFITRDSDFFHVRTITVYAPRLPKSASAPAAPAQAAPSH